MKITVAGVGYVGLSLAVLLAQHHEVTAITTTPEKAEKLNQFISPIQDDEIERFFAEARAGKRAASDDNHRQGRRVCLGGACHHRHADELRQPEELL